MLTHERRWLIRAPTAAIFRDAWGIFARGVADMRRCYRIVSAVPAPIAAVTVLNA